jgi:hypothetical protein
MERSFATKAVLVTFSVVCFIHHPSANAAFSFATCATSGWDAVVPSEIGAQEYLKKSTATPGAGDDMTLYNLNTSQSWPVYVNPNVHFLQPIFGFFRTEPCCDKLNVAAYNGTFSYSGDINMSNTTLVRSSDQWDCGATVSDVASITQTWTSDVSIAGFGPPTIAQVAPQCKTSQSPTAYNNITIQPNTRIDGLLIKPGDVFYANVWQSSNANMVIRLDGLNVSNGGDFDLYVSSSTATPDDSHFNYRGFSSLPSEALFVPSPGGSGRYLFIGVHSFGPSAGTGHFALSADTVAQQGSSVCVTDKLGNHVTLNSTDAASLKSYLKSGSASLYSYTNGMLFRNSFTLFNNWTACTTEAGCDICISTDPGGAANGGPVTGHPCGHINVPKAYWGNGSVYGWLFAHESGHSCFGIPDEYDTSLVLGDNTPRWCGHSTMANSSKATAFCSLAHCQDGQLSDPHCALPSNWSVIAASSSWAGQYAGPNFGALLTTAYPTPSWSNANLQSLVSFVGF